MAAVPGALADPFYFVRNFPNRRKGSGTWNIDRSFVWSVSEGLTTERLQLLTVAACLRTLMYTEVAPIAFASIEWRYYLVFILVPAACVPLQYLFLPESKHSAYHASLTQFQRVTR